LGVYELIAAIEQHHPPQGAASACRSATSSGIDDACKAVIQKDLDRLHIVALIVIDAPGADRISRVFADFFGRPPMKTGGVRLWTAPAKA
jgi:hypothetical protein